MDLPPTALELYLKTIEEARILHDEYEKIKLKEKLGLAGQIHIWNDRNTTARTEKTNTKKIQVNWRRSHYK